MKFSNPFRRKVKEKQLVNASVMATLEHEKVIRTIKEGRVVAEEFKGLVKRNGFTVQIAAAMGGHK